MPGYGSNNRPVSRTTPQMQRNVDRKRAEQNDYARQARVSVSKPIPSTAKSTTPKGEIPGVKKPVYVAPTKKTGLKSKVKAAVKRARPKKTK
jgi:hypothetical protein